MKTILCIDDEPSSIEARRLLLEAEGYHVITAESGEEGLRHLTGSAVDAVVVDFFMPRMNGLSVAQQIRKLDSTIPIIVLSGFAELPGESLGLVDDWIIKGRSTNTLLDTLAQRIKNRRQRGTLS